VLAAGPDTEVASKRSIIALTWSGTSNGAKYPAPTVWPTTSCRHSSLKRAMSARGTAALISSVGIAQAAAAAAFANRAASGDPGCPWRTGGAGPRGPGVRHVAIEIIGNVGSDPEQQFTKEGVSMASIRSQCVRRAFQPRQIQVQLTSKETKVS
jgi:hypothetical protein